MNVSKTLYLQVLAAVIAGVLLGHFYPDLAQQMQPLGDGFVKLIRMIIAPIVFITVVVGIAKLHDSAAVGRIGLKAIVYFEVLTTVSSLIGLIIGHVIAPGAGVHADAKSLNAAAVSQYISAPHMTVQAFLLNIIPNTVVDAFAKGEILQVLLVAVLFGIALSRAGARGRNLVRVIDEAGIAFFGIIGMIMKLAPIGAFGAMAFTIGKFGIGTLANLGLLMLCFYLTCAIFVFLVLGLVMAAVGLNIISMLRYLKDEFWIVLGTSSSEAALPSLIEKLEGAGCPPAMVGLTVPLGYAFNLDGTSIYFTMAIAFIAQALDIPLSWGDYLVIMAVLLLTSKGAAAVTGGGFITLAATLSSMHGKVPVEGIVLVLSIDRFMSEARAITNLFGNAVAAFVVAKWEGQLDTAKAKLAFAGKVTPPGFEPRLA